MYSTFDTQFLCEGLALLCHNFSQLIITFAASNEGSDMSWDTILLRALGFALIYNGIAYCWKRLFSK